MGHSVSLNETILETGSERYEKKINEFEILANDYRRHQYEPIIHYTNKTDNSCLVSISYEKLKLLNYSGVRIETHHCIAYTLDHFFLVGTQHLCKFHSRSLSTKYNQVRITIAHSSGYRWYQHV